jgi:hypothetical protein
MAATDRAVTNKIFRDVEEVVERAVVAPLSDLREREGSAQ